MIRIIIIINNNNNINSYRKRGCHDIMGHANTYRQENNSQQTRYSD